MTFLTFNKATDPTAPDDLRINPEAVLFVEASRADLLGQTTIQLLGQGTVVNAVTESVGTVVSSIAAGLKSPGLVGAMRHYLATTPEDGASTVYIAPGNVSYVRPNVPETHDFWYVRFVDGSELRIVDPLPAGL
ncbi:MAG: hypothetical protein HYX42_20385 [Polaromonas sp.]|uniref:hypothetical protein n=1 Tax=Polaromonas sp. TaxID=1869339 RepID=UPI0025F0F5BC|nr:hypothetical protein [Polaromonas sp.]MBI2728603.1 hypothetical protein [Polaromonas sp.]